MPSYWRSKKRPEGDAENFMKHNGGSSAPTVDIEPVSEDLLDKSKVR